MSHAFVAPDRPDNLFEPVRGDVGARGRFDAEAQASSVELWLATHPVAGLLGLLGIAGAAFALWRTYAAGELRKSRRSLPIPRP